MNNAVNIPSFNLTFFFFLATNVSIFHHFLIYKITFYCFSYFRLHIMFHCYINIYVQLHIIHLLLFVVLIVKNILLFKGERYLTV